MKEVTIKLHSNEDIWTLIDKSVNFAFIHKFMPNEALSWWKTDIKFENGEIFNDLSVREMIMDVQTDLNGLKKIIELNTRQLRIYQFMKAVPNTLNFDRLLENNNRYEILHQNGLKHFFFINFEYLTIASFDSEFISTIETDPK